MSHNTDRTARSSNSNPSRRSQADYSQHYRADGGETSGGVLVGVRATNGVLLAADTRTSRGAMVASDEAEKLWSVHPSAAIGSPVDLGDADAVARALRAEVDRYEHHRGQQLSVPALATAAGHEHRARPGLDATVVLGGIDETGSHVFAIGVDDGVVESDYAAAGTGRQSASGVLDRADTDSFSIADARDLVASAIESAAARDPRTGPAVDVAEIRLEGVDIHRYESTAAVRS